MASRREFLLGAGAGTLGFLLAGCQEQPTLRVRVLRSSIPPQVLAEFRRALKAANSDAGLDFKPEAQLKDLFTQLQTWKRQGDAGAQSTGGFRLPFLPGRSDSTLPNLVTLGDYWLGKAVQQQLLQPFDRTQIQGWAKLPRPWQTIVTRQANGQMDPKGQIWGVPYRWGMTVIAYRKDLLAQHQIQPPQDWADLWRPELRGHISLLDNPREVIGLTLKKLGQSYNQANLARVPTLKAELAALNRQAKLYSSDNYLQPLLLGDTWVTVGWSTDLSPLLQQGHSIAIAIPPSGTALWTDLWVQPAGNQAKNAADVVRLWLDFCWQPQTISSLARFSGAPSPLVQTAIASNLPEDVRQNPLLLPPSQIIERSEFLEPLSDAAVTAYRSHWVEMRQGNL